MSVLVNWIIEEADEWVSGQPPREPGDFVRFALCMVVNGVSRPIAYAHARTADEAAEAFARKLRSASFGR